MTVLLYNSCDIHNYTPARKEMLQTSYCTHLLVKCVLQAGMAMATIQFIWGGYLFIMCVCIYIYMYKYIYIYVYVYRERAIYVYIYIYIQTSRRYPVPSSSFYSFLLTARGALTVSRGGSYARGLIRLAHLGVDPWRYQVAKCAFSAGPDLGSFLSLHPSVQQ